MFDLASVPALVEVHGRVPCTPSIGGQERAQPERRTPDDGPAYETRRAADARVEHERDERDGRDERDERDVHPPVHRTDRGGASPYSASGQLFLNNIRTFTADGSAAFVSRPLRR